MANISPLGRAEQVLAIDVLIAQCNVSLYSEGAPLPDSIADSIHPPGPPSVSLSHITTHPSSFIISGAGVLFFCRFLALILSSVLSHGLLFCTLFVCFFPSFFLSTFLLFYPSFLSFYLFSSPSPFFLSFFSATFLSIYIY